MGDSTLEVGGTKGCALAMSLHSPPAHAGAPTKAKPFVPLTSTMHGRPLLIPLLIGEGRWLFTCASYIAAILREKYARSARDVIVKVA